MLDSIRAYAVERLREANEVPWVRDRMAVHFLRTAETAAPQLSGPEARHWLQLLDADHDNYLSLIETESGLDPDMALRLTVALADYWRLRGRYAEARQRLRRAALRSRERSPYLVRALLGQGMMAFLQVELVDARRFTMRALAISRRIGDERGRLVALEQLARIEFNLGDQDRARACLERGMDDAELLADPTILSSYYFLWGQISLARQRFEEAERLLEEAAELARQAHHGELSGLAWSTLGRLYLLQGRPAMAGPLLKQTLATVRDFGGPRHVVMLLDSLAAVAADEQDDARAARLVGAAAAVHEQAGSRRPATSPVWSQVAAKWQRTVSTSDGQKAYSEGLSMNLDQAISFALGEEGLQVADASATTRQQQLLTRRQLEIARLVAEGFTNREIARRLFISERTAEGHVEQIRNKLGFNSRVQIGAWISEHERPND
jgi:DNA-binding NarL/FixJ family response regulator